MQRKTKNVKIGARIFKLQSLFPADFLGDKFWPFAFFRTPEDVKQTPPAPEYDWKLKPKSMLDFEADMQTVTQRAIEIGGSLRFGERFEIAKEESFSKDVFTTKKSVLLSEIYALTYGLDTAQKLLAPFMFVRREWAEMIYFKAKFYACEPFDLIADCKKELPELYNPRRYDFNLFVLGCGWEKERREMEKAQAEMRSKTSMLRKK